MAKSSSHTFQPAPLVLAPSTDQSTTPQSYPSRVLSLIATEKVNVESEPGKFIVFCHNRDKPCSMPEPEPVYEGDDFVILACNQARRLLLGEEDEGIASECETFPGEVEKHENIASAGDLGIVQRIKEMTGRETGMVTDDDLATLLASLNSIDDPAVLRKLEVALKNKKALLKKEGKCISSVYITVSTDQTGKERVYEVREKDGRPARRSLNRAAVLQYDFSEAVVSPRAKEVIARIRSEELTRAKEVLALISSEQADLSPGSI